MTNRNKADGDQLTKAYREIGIRAVAATVKFNKQDDGSDEAQTDLGQTKQGQGSMKRASQAIFRENHKNRA
jgi:hypothetical protein